MANQWGYGRSVEVKGNTTVTVIYSVIVSALASTEMRALQIRSMGKSGIGDRQQLSIYFKYRLPVYYSCTR
jgi:hypothetical protein